MTYPKIHKFNFLKFFLFLILLLKVSALKAERVSVLDLVVIGRDTIVASTHDFWIIASRDGGKTWKKTKRELIKKLGKEKNVIWGIDSWRGIHEPPYSRLFYSNDFGQNWRSIELDPSIFAAEDFIEYKGSLFIVDFNGDLWQHLKVAKETASSWVKISHCNQSSMFFSIALPSFNGTYSVKCSYDSLFICNVINQKYFQVVTPVKFNSITSFRSSKEVVLLSDSGKLIVYNLETSKFLKLTSITGFRSFISMVKQKNNTIILGLINENNMAFSMATKLNATLNRTDFRIPGLDADISCVDKFDRIWFSTTEGIFMLQPDNTLSKIL